MNRKVQERYTYDQIYTEIRRVKKWEQRVGWPWKFNGDWWWIFHFSRWWSGKFNGRERSRGNKAIGLNKSMVVHKSNADNDSRTMCDYNMCNALFNTIEIMEYCVIYCIILEVTIWFYWRFSDALYPNYDDSGFLVRDLGVFSSHRFRRKNFISSFLLERILLICYPNTCEDIYKDST